MNWFALVVILLLVAVILWLAWRNISLRRGLRRYSDRVRSVANGELSVSDLPDDERGVEDFSNSVKSMALALRVRTSVVDAERTRLAAVLERMTDGVLIVDAGGIVQFANPAVERLFHVENAIGRSATEVLRQHQLIEAWQRSRDTNDAQEETVELPARHQFLQLVVLPDQRTGGSLLVVQDLTRVRRLETVRRDFISNVSHELRTPLASLKALAETLRNGALEDPQAAQRFLGRIETEVDALTQMATELLELSRIESGQVPLELKVVQVAELLQSAVERMRAQAERAGITLQLEPTENLPAVHADSPRLEQVLVNLIHNGVKFTRPGGEVALSAQVDGDFVRFAVRDNGVGIPEEDLSRIFERFYRVDRSRSGGGTGLGLSISRHLVEAHGGKIWAESVEGQGSTFCFTIPTLTKP